MRIKFLALLAGCVLLFQGAPLKAAIAANFVQYNAANATISGGANIALPISYTDTTTTGRWNFDPTFAAPLVPATTTTPAVYGGMNIVCTGTLGSVPSADLHNNIPAGWPNVPEIFVFSNAGSDSTKVNNVNALFMWKRSDFASNQPSYSATFNSSSTLSVNVVSWFHASPGDNMEIRFIILNGSTYYVSEAKAAAAGAFSLTNFNNNSAAGFRWAPITLTGTSFDIPQSGLTYAAYNFGNVQAVGWIGRGSRNYAGVFGFDTFSATGVYQAPVMKLSMNLGGIASYTGAHPFLDVMKYSAQWVTHNSDNIHAGPWGTVLNAYGLNLDSNGWPTKLPFTQTLIPGPYSGTQADPRAAPYAGNAISSQQYVHTLVQVYETGRYRLRFRGTGSFSIQGLNSDGTSWSQYFGPVVAGSNNPAGTALTSLPLDTDGVTRYWDSPAITVSPIVTNGQVTQGGGQLWINIFGSDPNSTGDYIRNFELLSPSAFTYNVAGDTVNRITSPFNPDFYSTLGGFGTLRMMDWGATNGSAVVNWTDRTLPGAYTQCQANGIALEYQIAICNTLNENIWVNVPHQATQDYVQKMALVLHNGSKADGTPYIPGTDAPSTLVWPGLKPSLKVYIEYSNETWNSFFKAQYNWCQTQGQTLGFPSGSYGDYYASYQSANCWQWFYNEWGTDATKRLVRVLGAQFSAGNAAKRLSAFDAGILATGSRTQYPDAVAVAPYFGGSVANSLVPTYVSTDGTINTATTSQIIGLAKTDVETGITQGINAIAAVANSYGVTLNCYEGGQGIVGTYANMGNNTLTADLEAANADPSMGTLYTEYLGILQGAGVAEFCHFNHIGGWSGSGCWGTMQYINQPSAKYNALVTYKTSFPNANSNIPPIVSLTSTLGGTVVPVPEAVLDSTGAGSVTVPISAAGSVDYDGTIASTQWIINGAVQSTTANAISPSLPVGNNTITVSVTDNSGSTSSDSVQILVRPRGSDTVIAQSNFTGAGNGITGSLTQTPPWTPYSVLASGLGYSGWTYLQTGYGVHNRISDANYPNAYRVSIMNPYPSTGSPTSATPELLADSITNSNYLTVTVTPPSGHSLDLRGAAVQWTLNPLNNGSSARATALFVGIGGLAAQPAVGSALYDSSLVDYPSGITSPASFTYYFPVTSTYSNITQPTEFRVYFYNNTYGFREIQLNAFQLTGVIH